MNYSIHDINNYKSRYDFRDLFLILSIKQETLNHYLEELHRINFKIKEATISYKKNRSRRSKDNISEFTKHHKRTYKSFENTITETGLLNSFEDLKNPKLFDELIDQLGMGFIANRLHSDSLKLSFKVIQNNEINKTKFIEELKKINITYKQAVSLVKSVIQINEDDYFKACRVIESNFLKLPMLTDRTGCEGAIIGCLRGEKHLIDTHSSFKLIHNKIDFPEIFLIKVAISKAFAK
jgi:hypothetical protein